MPEALPRAIDAISDAAESALSPPSAAEQELSDFSYIVSHDLAASLRYVAEFSNLLVSDLGADATETQRTYAKHVQRATDKTRLMLDQLLAYSRAQQRPLTAARCNITRLMELAVLQLSAETRASSAEISIAPMGDYIVDAELLTLAFKHALGNAIKFARPGIAPRIEVRAFELPDAWAVQITDNGIGVALDRQEKMFRMFYQDHPENRYPGAGAGLAICRRILRRHGGDARFIATEGDGACLELHLPYTEGTA